MSIKKRTSARKPKHYALLSRDAYSKYIAEFWVADPQRICGDIRVTEIVAGSPQMAKMSLKKAGLERGVRFEYPLHAGETYRVEIPTPAKWFWAQFI